MSSALVTGNKGMTVVSTPLPLFNAINKHFEFTLDAAADETNHKCAKWLEGPCHEGEVITSPCTHDPKPIAESIGMYHCPECSEMVVAGMDHTPADYPCSCGLCADYLENVVFLNPPYTHMEPWIGKCIYGSQVQGATIALLCNAAVGAKWWRMAEASPYLHEIWYISGRVKFDGYPDMNPVASAVLTWKPVPTKRISTVHWDWHTDAFTQRIEGVQV